MYCIFDYDLFDTIIQNWYEHSNLMWLCTNYAINLHVNMFRIENNI